MHDYEQAAALLNESLALFRQVENDWGEAAIICNLGRLALLRGDHAAAYDLMHDCRSRLLVIGDDNSRARHLYHLGVASHLTGRSAEADQFLREAIELAESTGYLATVSFCLAGRAWVIAEQDEPVRAVHIWGAADALRQSAGSAPEPAESALYQPIMDAVRSRLGEAAFAAAWADGSSLTLHDAIALALKAG